MQPRTAGRRRTGTGRGGDHRDAAPSPARAAGKSAAATTPDDGSSSGYAAVRLRLTSRASATGRANLCPERICVLSGSVRSIGGGVERVLSAGETVVSRPGELHTVGPVGETAVEMVVECRPALGFEAFIERTFALDRAGRLHAKGRGNPLRVATTMPHDAEFFLSRVSLGLQASVVSRTGSARPTAPLRRLTTPARVKHPNYQSTRMGWWSRCTNTTVRALSKRRRRTSARRLAKVPSSPLTRDSRALCVDASALSLTSTCSLRTRGERLVGSGRQPALAGRAVS